MLGEGDLDDALAGSRALSEDVEDEGGAVDDFELESSLERALLGRREFVIEDGDGGRDFVAQAGDLFQLAFADVGAGIGMAQALLDSGERHRAGGEGELGEFLERGVDAPV